jgi:hypothetical protein
VIQVGHLIVEQQQRRNHAPPYIKKLPKTPDAIDAPDAAHALQRFSMTTSGDELLVLKGCELSLESNILTTQKLTCCRTPAIRKTGCHTTDQLTPTQLHQMRNHN